LSESSRPTNQHAEQNGLETLVTDAAPAIELSGPQPLEEVFSPSDTLARVSGDWELYREVAELFASSSRSLMEEIWQAADASDGARLSRAAHTLKGAVSNFGAVPCAEQAYKLELLGREGALGAVGKQCRLLERELERLRGALQKFQEDRDEDSHC